MARGLVPRVLLTGQHPALDPREHGFENLPCVRLGCSSGRDPHAFVGQVVGCALPLIAECDLVVVQGDTSSALGGALAAFQSGVPVAHVEAGLRSHDLGNPWPEEEFRLAIDERAALLFAPTELSAANLRREGARGEIHVTGNTGVDAALARAAELPPLGSRSRGMPRLLVTCHRRDSWGDGLASIAAALRRIATGGLAEISFVLHPNPRVAEEMRRFLCSQPGIELRPPCAHDEMLRAMREADLVLSDSGGMQEEAAALGVPLLVLRDSTERPEGIVTGNLQLVGVDPARILPAVQRLLEQPKALEAMRAPTLVYGDGRAAGRIAKIIAHWVLQGAPAWPPQEPAGAIAAE